MDNKEIKHLLESMLALATEAELNEDTTGAAADNIAVTDENLSVQTIYQQTSLPSLGRQIFSLIPMHGATAALFNIRRKEGTDDVELVRRDVEVFPSSAVHTGVSQETIQDLRAQYGKEADQIVGKMLKGITNEKENEKTIAFLDAQCESYPDLTLTDITNAEMNLFQISQKVQEIVLKMNSTSLKTFEAFAVIPYKPLAGVMALKQYVGADNTDERGLFVTQIGQTKFYYNPVAESTTAYVGLKCSDNPSKSSAVFSPYEANVVEATDPSSGDKSFHIYNRYAITASPLHDDGNKLLYKFNIL